jgi:general secretion pathway protein K
VTRLARAPSERAGRKRAVAAVRKLRQRRQRRGVALIMVLGAITVLTVFLTELQEETSSELSSALVERDTMRAEYLARSSINLSRMLIASEPTIRARIAPLLQMLGMKSPPQIPIWEFSDMVLAPFNDEASAMAFGAVAGLDQSTGKNMGLGVGAGSFTVRIVDEEAKINANAAAKPGDILSRGRFGAQMFGLLGPPQYNEMFEQQDADGQYSDRATICGAVVDWSDMDEELYACDPTMAQAAGSAGAEDSFYQLIGMPYRRKNTAFDSLEELRQVRGFNDDFWATFVDPDPTDPKSRVMTVWGGATVNVNTANAQTLLALICANSVPDTQLCIDPIQQATFLAMVSMARTAIPIPIFTSPKNFTAIVQGKGSGMGKMIWEMMGLTPVVLKSAADTQKQVSTGSKMFSIYAEGLVPGTNKRETRARVHAVVDFRFAAVPGDFPLSMQPTNPQDPANTQPASQMTPEAAAAMLQSNPAGNVVYWRLE